ncbi:hypothetical protein SZN_25504, partial [Streptomyces zinciresistens K42]
MLAARRGHHALERPSFSRTGTGPADVLAARRGHHALERPSFSRTGTGPPGHRRPPGLH